jgi:O-succinylbenzoate synthase
MKLAGIELVRVDLPFRAPIRTAAETHTSRALLFVRLVTDEGEGWGECAALLERTAVDPSVAEVALAAEERGAPRLLTASAARGGALPGGAEIASLFGSSPVDRMLGAALEMAVTDLELRQAGQSLSAWLELAAGFESLPVGAAVGIPEGRQVDALLASVAEAVADGIGRVRMKIEPGWDVEPVRAVRQAFPHLVLQADANGSYRAGDADHLDQLGQFDLACVEQPLPPADLVALAQLAARISVPVCLDESLASPRRVLDALRNGACRVACLKPARLGGLRATLQAHRACVEAGVPVFVGGFFETGLGRSANLALAARLQQDAPGLVGDLSDPASYLAVDPCGYPLVHQGWVRVPDHPGVGGWPDELTLAEFAPQRSWFPATYT